MSLTQHTSEVAIPENADQIGLNRILESNLANLFYQGVQSHVNVHELRRFMKNHVDLYPKMPQNP